MRTALVLLFLLALARGPRLGRPAAATSTRSRSSQLAGPRTRTLTPIYEKLGLFDVYNSVWFSAIYILLMVSLVGCIVPRLRVYWRGAAGPAAARRRATSTRLPGVTRRFELDEDARRGARAGPARCCASGATGSPTGDGDAVSAERGYLREAGNLLFHLSVLVVLVGFASAQLFGYKGGVIVVVGNGFSNTLSQYDDFAPGSAVRPRRPRRRSASTSTTST